MLRLRLMAIIAMLFLSAGWLGCAGSPDSNPHLPQTMVSLKPKKGFNKKIAVILTQTPATDMGKKIGDLFYTTLVKAIQEEDARLLLVTPESKNFPAFMAPLARSSGPGVKAIDLAARGRMSGFNGLVLAAVRDIRPYTKKTGILWFRKVRYFISFDLTVDLYDPFTAAKMVSAVEEASIKVDDFEYEAFLEGITTDVEELEEAIIDFGEKLGEQVSEALKEGFWRTSVVKVQDQRVYLPAGQQAGLQTGMRLAVFEGRRQIEGKGNERFIVPGLQVATIQVNQVGPADAQAVILDEGSVKAGDIAVPVN